VCLIYIFVCVGVVVSEYICAHLYLCVYSCVCVKGQRWAAAAQVTSWKLMHSITEATRISLAQIHCCASAVDHKNKEPSRVPTAIMFSFRPWSFTCSEFRVARAGGNRRAQERDKGSARESEKGGSGGGGGWRKRWRRRRRRRRRASP